jgi:hypothetical protein
MATQLAKKNIYAVKVVEYTQTSYEREWNPSDSIEYADYKDVEIKKKFHRVFVHLMDTYEMEKMIDNKVAEVYQVVKDLGNMVTINRENIFVKLADATVGESVHQHDLFNVSRTMWEGTYYVCSHKGIKGEYVNGVIKCGQVNYDMHDPSIMHLISSGEWLTDDDFELCCIVQDYIKSTGKWDDRYDIEN